MFSSNEIKWVSLQLVNNYLSIISLFKTDVWHLWQFPHKCLMDSSTHLMSQMKIIEIYLKINKGVQVNVQMVGGKSLFAFHNPNHAQAVSAVSKPFNWSPQWIPWSHIHVSPEWALTVGNVFYTSRTYGYGWPTVQQQSIRICLSVSLSCFSRTGDMEAIFDTTNTGRRN